MGVGAGNEALPSTGISESNFWRGLEVLDNDLVHHATQNYYVIESICRRR
jgi:hypothetical protein